MSAREPKAEIKARSHSLLLVTEYIPKYTEYLAKKKLKYSTF